LVEQLIRNEKVGGSTPLSGTNKIKDLVSFWAKSFSLSELDSFAYRLFTDCGTGFLQLP
jgi:hypothetical protein